MLALVEISWLPTWATDLLICLACVFLGANMKNLITIFTPRTPKQATIIKWYPTKKRKEERPPMPGPEVYLSAELASLRRTFRRYAMESEAEAAKQSRILLDIHARHGEELRLADAKLQHVRHSHEEQMHKARANVKYLNDMVDQQESVMHAVIGNHRKERTDLERMKQKLREKYTRLTSGAEKLIEDRVAEALKSHGVSLATEEAGKLLKDAHAAEIELAARAGAIAAQNLLNADEKIDPIDDHTFDDLFKYPTLDDTLTGHEAMNQCFACGRPMDAHEAGCFLYQPVGSV